jgi:hypothetical protein
MSLREEWEFEYTARTLAIAAAAQRDHRASRIELWTSKKAEVMQKIKDSGISVSESMSDILSSNGNYGNTMSGRGAHITIDTTLQADLNECVGKIRSHTSLRDEYDAWVQVLEANPESRLKLRHDDWMFFWGK